MLESIFKAILITSFMGAVSTIGLTLIKPITKKYFSASWHYYIWIAVLITMVLPLRFVMPERNSVTTVQENMVIRQENHIEESPVLEFVKNEEELPKIMENTTIEKEFDAIESFATSKMNMLSKIWILGAIAFFLFKLSAYIVFVVKLRKDSEETYCPELRQYTNKKIITRKSNKISSPLMLGIIRPTLLMPETEMTKTQIDSVLAHEMTHFKRKDILCKWFAYVVKCIHWFNPVVYYIARQVNIECEISCDLAVVRGMNKEQEKSYIETILTLATAKNRQITTMTTAMASDKKLLKRRFSMIKNKGNISKKAIIISVIIALVVLVGTAFASGLLNGKFINNYENELLAVNTDARQGDDFNFLLLGLDKQNRADTIMVLSVNGEDVTGISIPRETVFIIDGIKARANDILNGENGNQKLIDTIKETLSIPITYYAKVNLSAIENLIDSVGGLEIDVPMDAEYNDPEQNLRIKLKQGRHTLTGSAVCGLLQFRRSDNGSGYGERTRIEVGQQVIKEFISQKLNKEFINKAPKIFKALMDNVETNYPVSNLESDVKLIEKLKSGLTFKTLSGANIIDDTGYVMYEEETGEVVSVVSKPSERYKVATKKNAESVDVEIREVEWENMIMPCEGEITSPFGKRVHPITNEEKVHNGIDIKAPVGTMVVASISGTVTDMGYDAEKGNYIVVERDNIKTTYSQLSKTSVKKGDSVSPNQAIGAVGNTGASTGAHLHFEVMLDGEYVDPKSLID